ncbi:MAG: tetratricopeptide repeat protein [Phycisphaerae bacterium]
MAQVTISQAFQLALQHHQAGRLQEAEQIYRQILAHQPGHADALHLLGVIASQVGRFEVAVDLIGQAIAQKPNVPEMHNNLGNALKDLGRFEEANAAYRQAIALKPDFPEAHSNYGNVLVDQGRLEEATVVFRQAIALRPNYPEAHYNLGNALRVRGHMDEAIVAYRAAIRLRPNYVQAQGNLGVALKVQGLLEEAIATFRQALALNPNLPETHNNLCNALREKGCLDEALVACRQALALQPNLPEAYCNLGNVLSDQGCHDEAIAAYRQALALNANLSDAHCNLGGMLKEKGQFEEAIAACRRALELKPNYPEAYLNLGNALREQGRLDEALAAYRQALALKPDDAAAYSNLAIVLSDQGCLDEAIGAYRQAITIKPNYPEAHKDLALLLLLRGDFAEGCKEYEWRWRCKNYHSPVWNVPELLWDGSDLAGRTLLLHAEQGFGDCLQFIRYVPQIAARAGGGKILVVCAPELRPLLQSMSGVAGWLVAGDVLPHCDVQCPLLSLPLVLGTTLENIPQGVPYLQAEAARVEWWRRELADAPPGLQVGLVWSGNPAHKNDRNRSVALAALAPLARMPGVRFYSLQKGAAGEQARTPPAGMELIDRTAELKDFADTAALVANLDLVIAVDTAVVHLAGALGKSVWTLLPFVPDWRWLMEREDSPWYPTMRLFRQRVRGDWGSVIDKVAKALVQRSLGPSTQHA